VATRASASASLPNPLTHAPTDESPAVVLSENRRARGHSGSRGFSSPMPVHVYNHHVGLAPPRVIRSLPSDPTGSDERLPVYTRGPSFKGQVGADWLAAPIDRLRGGEGLPSRACDRQRGRREVERAWGAIQGRCLTRRRCGRVAVCVLDREPGMWACSRPAIESWQQAVGDGLSNRRRG
jgi:hypothetical protein